MRHTCCWTKLNYCKKREVTVDKCNKTIMKGMCLQIGKTNKGLLMKKTTQQ